jgi:hypothetical protein
MDRVRLEAQEVDDLSAVGVRERLEHSVQIVWDLAHGSLPRGLGPQPQAMVASDGAFMLIVNF